MVVVVVGGGSTHYRPYLRVYFSFFKFFLGTFYVDPELDNNPSLIDMNPTIIKLKSEVIVLNWEVPG